MDQALVSVIIPVFNGEKYIRCAIDSVLEQDYKPIEIIVIDDGSSDATLEILRDLGNEISIYHQPNKGSAAARNLGIRMAKGSYIAFLDADDYWFPGKISAQMEALLATGCKMAFSRFLFWNVSDDDACPIRLRYLSKIRLDNWKNRWSNRGGSMQIFFSTVWSGLRRYWFTKTN